MVTDPSALSIGLAGWSYPDWRGAFYPQERDRSFSELRYAAERFDCLEINSSFYRIPNADHASRWMDTVADLDGFEFTAKLTRSLTHEAIDATQTRSLCRQFLDGFAPLIEGGALSCVVAQFPWFFEDSQEHRERIASFAEHLRPLELSVEIRHRSFLGNDEESVLPFLGERAIGFVNIDLPRAKTSPPQTCINTNSLGYFRLHGRNAKNWFRKNAGRDEKYDYLYSAQELENLFPLIQRLAGRTRRTYVITNNHFAGQAVVNAQQIIRLAGREPVPSDPLLEKYPGWAKDVDSARLSK